MRDTIVDWKKLNIEKDGKPLAGMIDGIPVYEASEGPSPKGEVSLYSWDKWKTLRAAVIWKESDAFNERKIKLRILRRKRRYLWQYRIFRLLCRWWGIAWEEITE